MMFKIAIFQLKIPKFLTKLDINFLIYSFFSIIFHFWHINYINNSKLLAFYIFIFYRTIFFRQEIHKKIRKKNSNFNVYLLRDYR